jgi:uncharacterized membrane protein
MSKIWGVFLMPLIILGMFLLFLVIPHIDPLRANIAQFRETFNVFIVLIVAFMVYIYGLSIAWNLGYTSFKMSTSMLPAMGLLFIFIGFLFRRAKRNWFIGIHCVDTFQRQVWVGTHRLSSVLFMLSGVLASSALFGEQ